MERKLTILEEELDQLKVTSPSMYNPVVLSGRFSGHSIHIGSTETDTETWVLSTWCLGEIRDPTQGVNM